MQYAADPNLYNQPMHEWALAESVIKAAVENAAAQKLKELRETGVRAYNIQPGYVATERIAQDMKAFGFDASTGAPAAVIGKVCRWLLESPDAPKRRRG